MNRMRLIAVGLVSAVCLGWVWTNAAEDAKTEWTAMTVPGTWEELAPKQFGDYDGYAWYRCEVVVPEDWKGLELQLSVEKVDNAHEAYFNGRRIGGTGSFPPKYQSGLASKPQFYPVSVSYVKAGEKNVIAFRVYDADGRGGFKGKAPVLMAADGAIVLKGEWQFRTGDDKKWASAVETQVAKVRPFEELVPRSALVGENESNPGALAPKDAAKTFTVPEDLVWQQVLSEPQIRQPIFLNFDERGRMWVMEYKQYPYPAGLKMVSKDKFWRAVYDKVPEPPPHGTKGADTISIHEDTDGDGQYDSRKVFVEGLNIASSFVKGRGGVWVLNPPYLLFYPDKNNDDVPDSDPVVHLSGFGMQDTHSVVNSLRWGPDGWLYAAQGSTVSGNVMRPGLDKKPKYSMGQLIWRYHPETKRYEIFAEGGGNAFGVEIDDQGRVYSGHNGGNTRGFHYVQGGYYRKGFGKHGPLSNPYTFGYFEAMKHHSVPRFTHNFVIYEGHTLPEKYEGRLFGVEPLQGRVVMSEVSTDGSSYKTEDLGHPVVTTDRQFRPVDIKLGPDGAIYVADMYEPQISHRQHFSGQIDKTNGRIYRLQNKDVPKTELPNFGKLSSEELVKRLDHPNRWHRQTILRVLGDRKDASIIPLLKQNIREQTGQLALESLWALNLSGGFNEEVALETLNHENPAVRMWTVRLLCDDFEVSNKVAKALAQRAEEESYVQVRSQLACSARRLPAEQSLPIVANLIKHEEDEGDVHLPLLLWWAVEAKADSNPEAILGLLEDKSLWQQPLVQKHLLSRLMRRYAQSGARTDLLVCAKLLNLSPDKASTAELMKGFEEAFKGRTLTGLPVELADALAKAGGGSVSLGIRRGDAEAIQKALATIADPKAPVKTRAELMQVFGEVDQPKAVPTLLEVMQSTKDATLQKAALTALGRYSADNIGAAVLGSYPKFSEDVQTVAQTLLASRKSWAKQLLEAVEAKKIAADSLPLDLVRQLTFHRDDRIAELIQKHWQDLEGASTAEMQQQIELHSKTLAAGEGDPYQGKVLYAKTCGKCHILFEEGGRIGPNLTTYKRDDISRILMNIVNPSAEVREGFESYLVLTTEGRTASGFLFDQDNRVVVLRGVDGQNITLPRDQIEEMIPQKKSLMPEGLLRDLTPQQVRDLFAYLRSSQPLNN